MALVIQKGVKVTAQEVAVLKVKIISSVPITGADVLGNVRRMIWN
jgi:hypothetical protein